MHRNRNLHCWCTDQIAASHPPTTRPCVRRHQWLCVDSQPPLRIRKSLGGIARCNSATRHGLLCPICPIHARYQGVLLLRQGAETCTCKLRRTGNAETPDRLQRSPSVQIDRKLDSFRRLGMSVPHGGQIGPGLFLSIQSLGQRGM